MIVVLDTSAAIEFILHRAHQKSVQSALMKADSVIAPDMYIPEITNVLWKYNQFESLKETICEELIEKSIQLIDHFESSLELYREAFQMACKTRHAVYDALYIVLARRNNALLLSVDKKLNDVAKSHGIKILNLK